MIEYVMRYSVETGKERDFQTWLETNEPWLASHYNRAGWRYLGTWACIYGHNYDFESRFELDNAAALDVMEMDDDTLRLTNELLGFIGSSGDGAGHRDVHVRVGPTQYRSTPLRPS